MDKWSHQFSGHFDQTLDITSPPLCFQLLRHLTCPQTAVLRPLRPSQKRRHFLSRPPSPQLFDISEETEWFFLGVCVCCDKWSTRQNDTFLKTNERNNDLDQKIFYSFHFLIWQFLIDTSKSRCVARCYMWGSCQSQSFLTPVKTLVAQLVPFLSIWP